MSDALTLSRRLIDLYNRRDLDGMLELFGADVEFIRPGPVVLRGRDAVRQRYEEDWRTFDESTVDISHALQAGTDVAAEIRMRLRRGEQTTAADGAIFHAWQGGMLVRYRAFFDLPPF